MKFSKKLKFSLLFVCSILLIFASVTANAVVEPRTTDSSEDGIMPISIDEDEVSTQKNENNSKTLYLGGSSVNIDYPVDGNVFVLANNVTISGKIIGNVFILAQNVNIESKAYINSTLFVCAEDLTISGVVFDVFSITESTSINSSARILRDATMGGGSLDLAGTISRDANLGFNSINVASASAKIGGDLNYSSKEEAISKDIVQGELTFNKAIEGEKAADVAMDYLSDFLQILVVALIIILIIVLAIPKFAEKEQKILENKTWPSIGYGALALIAIPVICFILFCTIIGIIPALSALFAYIFVLSFMVSALVAIPLAKILCKKMNKDTKGMNIFISTLLVAVIWLLEKIPVLGTLISLYVAIQGLGLLAYSIFHSKIEEKTIEEKEKNVIAKASVVVEDKKDKVEESKTEKNDTNKEK